VDVRHGLHEGDARVRRIGLWVLVLMSWAGSLALPARAADRPAPPRGGHAPAPRLENRTVAVYGLGQHFLEGGHGATVILLHGFGGSSDGWRGTATALASQYRVLVPDQIGFGGSDKPPIDYSLTTLTDFLEEFMTTLGVERATLIGHSMGARVATLFTLAHPDRVDRLVLVSGSGFAPNMDPAVLRALNFNTVAGARRLLSLLYYDDAAHVTDAAARQLFGDRMRSGAGYTLSRIQESFQRGEGFVDDMSPIKVPTLIIWGRDDEINSAATAARTQAQIAGSRVVLLERCGHLPMAEAPDKLLAAIKEFLATPLPQR
jgi:pimeloyl-ACP methyl ester carboxylesterase